MSWPSPTQASRARVFFQSGDAAAVAVNSSALSSGTKMLANSTPAPSLAPSPSKVSPAVSGPSRRSSASGARPGHAGCLNRSASFARSPGAPVQSADWAR
ncbi:hypothetical protein AOC05_17550 [Arthrobacter alpinus]|uniref:Uncharacterized protein n=1 Tax=Arthrobacter alpinus TaxID=656366 RepID=A0A0M4RRZ3_9MICC|nr:hypothetical protein AOC05_17550 [Arthrobacter alpinus]